MTEPTVQPDDLTGAWTPDPPIGCLLPGATAEPMAAIDDCEHHYETRLLGGHPITVRACTLCRKPDWDDLREQAAELYRWGWGEGAAGKPAREALSAYDKPREAADGPAGPRDTHDGSEAAPGGSGIRPGPYRHHKGGVYEVTGTATHTETGEQFAIYHSDSRNWARPVSDFLGTVNGEQRFTPIEPEPTLAALAAVIEFRDPCPYCESSPDLIPRHRMAAHIAEQHPEVRPERARTTPDNPVASSNTADNGIAAGLEIAIGWIEHRLGQTSEGREPAATGLRARLRTVLAPFIDPDDDCMPTLSKDGNGFTWVPAEGILDKLTAVVDAELREQRDRQAAQSVALVQRYADLQITLREVLDAFEAYWARASYCGPGETAVQPEHFKGWRAALNPPKERP